METYQPQFEPWNKYDQDLENRMKDFLCGRLKELCYRKVMDLDVSFAYSEEPIPFEQIQTLSFSPIRTGDIWARKNFACAWFHLTGRIPAEMDRSDLYLDFANDGEGLLVDREGSALKGFTAGSLVFGMVDYSVEKRYYPLEELIDEQGNIDLYLDGASNSLLGEYVYDASRLKAASVVRENRQMHEIFWDFDTLLDYVCSVGPDDPNKQKILYGLRSIRNLIVYEDPNAYQKAKKIANELFSLPGNEKLQVTAVGHAHLDLAWLWPIRESKRKAKRTFANFVYLLERYPQFRFAVSQPQQLAWMKELDPKLYRKLLEYEKEGRMEIVGGGWVENDTNIPCGESLVRQELYGQKFWLEEFGHYVRLRWLPDTFGYSACLPQILKQSKQDYFMTIKISWSNRTLFPYNTFRWEGIDGSQVVVHMPPEGNYNSVAGPSALINAKRGIKRTDPQDKMMLVYGVGDGGGGPSETTVERCLRTEKIPYLPKVKMDSAQGYFDGLAENKLPVYAGEMYLEKHRATYTSQSNNKNANREFEEKMLSLETLLSCLGIQGDKAALDELWKEALLYQFHDILPGSSIKRVYEETDAAYQRMFAKLDEMANDLHTSFAPGGYLMNPSGQERFRIERSGNDYLLYQGCGELIAPSLYENPTVSDSVSRLVTGDYVVEFASDGSFASISMNATGEIAVEKANRLRVFVDIGDAWDFEDDYRDQPEQYMELRHTQVRDFGELVEIRQNYEFRNSSLVQTIVIHRHDPCIRITHDVDWKDSGYMIRAEFLPKAWNTVVHSDIQFGYLDRLTTDDTVHNAAQFEICCQKWFDISNEHLGFSILNNAKNGFMAKHGIISLNLLRSTDYPCVQGDQTPTHYAYALYPHTGGFDAVKIDKLANEFSARPLYGDIPVIMPAFDNEQIQVTAFKPAYDGDGFILRAFERMGRKAVSRLTLPQGYILVGEVDLLEDPVGEAQETVHFNPFQIHSFRVKKTVSKEREDDAIGVS